MDARIIFGIVALAVLLVACAVHWFAADCSDFEEFFIDEYGWITALIVCVLAGIVFGCVFWVWQIMLMIVVPIFVLLIACIIHWFAADCMDFEDFFIDEYGWVTITAVCVLTGIVFGFIFWVWWAMLIIIGAVLLLGGGVAIVLYKKGANESEEEKKEVKTNFRCPNCGANIVKEETFFEKRFYCKYCDTEFTLKELKRGEAKPSEQEAKVKEDGIDLSDFEEEYFDACYRFKFRPYNKHGRRQLERRYEQLQNRLFDIDKLYEDTDRDDDELLDEAYAFLSEEEAIGAYLNEEKEEVIKERYEYFLENYIADEEDEEDEEDDI